jgi:replicative DNA helicase
VAASLEHQVVSKIVELQDFHLVEKLRIDETYFFSPECRTIFQYLRDHFHSKNTFNSVPSFQLVSQIFPGFQYAPSTDSLNTLIEQMRLAKMRVEALDYGEKIMRLAESNPRAALEAIRAAAAEMSSRHEFTNDMLLSDAYDELFRDYEMVSTGHGITGLPWPWAPLNEATQGMHPGEFILIYGRPKSMKTWVAIYIVTLLNMYCNARVLVYSLEMKPKIILRRVAAVRSVINYKTLLAGKLQPHDHDRFFMNLAELKNEAKTMNGSARHAAFLVTGGGGNNGINFLHSKIREFRPDIVLIDGLYLMNDDRQNKKTVDWKAIAHISQDTKVTAREFNLPILATGQANRGASKDAKDANVSEIAYSDALGQDTDFSMRVGRRKDPSTREPELVLAFPGSRETDLDSLLIHGIPALNFGLKSTFVVDAEEDDDQNGQQKYTKKSNGEAKVTPTIPAARLRNA